MLEKGLNGLTGKVPFAEQSAPETSWSPGAEDQR